MTTAADAALRGWRLLAVASTITALALAGHSLAGGAIPGPAALTLLGVPVLIGSAALARRRLRARTLLPLAVAAQLGLHHGSTWLSGPTSITPGSGHHPVALRTLMPEHASAATADHGLMLAAHLIAAGLTVALLLAVERGLLGLRRRWLALLPLLGGTAPIAHRPVGAVPSAPRRTIAVWSSGAQGVRGPPRAHGAA